MPPSGKPKKALDLTSVPELAMALPAAYEALKAAMEAYTRDLCAGWDARRGSRPYLAFSQSRFFGRQQGWEGTPFTAASSGVAEFYDKVYDTYQVLERMPAVHTVFAPKAFIAMATRRKL